MYRAVYSDITTVAGCEALSSCISETRTVPMNILMFSSSKVCIGESTKTQMMFRVCTHTAHTNGRRDVFAKTGKIHGTTHKQSEKLDQSSVMASWRSREIECDENMQISQPIWLGRARCQLAVIVLTNTAHRFAVPKRNRLKQC